MICPKCRKRIEDISIVCSYCGERVSSVAPSTFTSTYSTTTTHTIPNNTRKKHSSGGVGSFIFVVSLVLMILMFFINAASTLSTVGITVFLVGVLLCSFSRYLKYRNTSKHPTDKIGKSILKRIAQENNEDVHLVAKKVPIARVILTLCFSLILFFVLDGLYYQYYLIPILAAILLAYETLFLKYNTFSVLYKKAKKNPDLTATDIVTEETYNEVDTPQIAKSALICIAAVLIAIGGFIYLNLESKFSVEDVDGGVSITKYETGLLSLQKNIEIPETINGKTVVAISKDAFAWNIYTTSISIPDTVKTIGNSAFYDCRSLKSIEMSPNVTEIGDSAFESCYSLKKIDVPTVLVKMGSNVFNDCKSLTSVNIPEGVTIIPKGTFEGCSKLETVNWHEGITEIQSHAFKDCDTITEAGFPESITKIADHLFEDCDNLQTVYIPQGVKSIGTYAFNSCKSLSYVFIPDSITEIGKYAFDECESLSEIYLPKGFSVGKDIFDKEVTTLKQKNFTDEVTAKIDKEFEDFTIEKIYVVYDKNKGKDIIFSPENNGSITVSHTERFTERLADNMDLFVIESPVEFKEYLKKAKDAGMVNVLLAFDSQVAAEAARRPFFVSYNFDIEALIESYEEDPTMF